MTEQSTRSRPGSPPAGYMRVDSQVPGVIVYAPQPKTVQADQAKRFNCPNCGAAIAYDVAAGGIACEYCGYTAPVKSIHVGKTADEFEFTLETVSQAERGWGIKRQLLHCDACGAELSLPEGRLSTTCPFCASNQVNISTSLEETLRPRFIIPFKIPTEQTRRLAADFLGKGWFHPDQLKAATVIQRISGIYLPFWTFDTQVEAQWRAQVGYEHTERHYNAHEKRWETRTRIVWRWENGHVQLSIDDLLVSGSSPKHISQHILKNIYPFQMQSLMAYEPGFLAGWQAQAYQTTLTDAWESGKSLIRENARQACYQDIPTHHIRNFSMSADFEDEEWRYILLPVYLASYQFEDEIYQLMINGQTGSVAGQKPVAWWKVWLAIGAMLTPGIILGMIGLPLMLIGGAGVIPIGLGIILFILGLILSILLYNKARGSEAK